MGIRLRYLIAALTVIVVIAGIGTVGFLGWRYADLRGLENARTAALEAAEEYAVTMFGYNAENVADHVAQSRQVLVGTAATEYDEIVSESNLIDEVRTQQVVSDAAIQEAGVVTNTRDSATVLLFINLSVTRGTGERELTRLDPSRVTYDMVRRDGRWVIEQVEAIEDNTLRDILIEEGEDVGEGSLDADPGAGDVPQPEPTPVPGG